MKRNSAVFRVIFISYFRENFEQIFAEFHGISFRENVLISSYFAEFRLFGSNYQCGSMKDVGLSGV